MRDLRFIPIALLLLSACAQGGSDIGPEAALVKDYSPEFQARAADELEVLPADSAVGVLVADYAVLREQLRGGGGK